MDGARWWPRGLRFLAAHPSIAALALLPALVNAALLVGWLLSVLWYADDMVSWLWPGDPNVYRSVLAVLLGAVVFGLGALVVYAVAGIVGGPFWDRMSERIEEVVTQAAAPSPPYGRVAGLWWSGVHTAASIGLWTSVSASFLLFELIPVVGAVVQVVGQIVLTSLFVARELLDPATTRRNLRYREKWALVDRHRETLLGLGGVATLTLMVPLVQFVAAPVGIAAATLWLLDLEAREAR